MSDNIVVALRVRPLISREVQDSVKLYWKVENNYITQIDPDTKKSIGSSEFDKVFDSHISNHEIYEEVAFPIVQSALTGINGTIFAYGQTSSGKTFTMTGNKVTPGIIPLSIQDIFQSIENTPDREFLLRASYMEIYQENICDLLTGVKIPTLREDSSGSITVPGLKEVCVTNEKMVTDYVVLYFVQGVNSVAKLFPRLSVIRGGTLFYDYALVLIDNHDLREIGPWSLRSVNRGAIRLESNIVMCLDNTNQFDKLTQHEYYRNLNFIYKNFNYCPFDDCEEEGWCTAREKCCHDYGGCFEGQRCHKECLGGCNCPNDATCCAACKRFLLKEVCVTECPKNKREPYLKYLDYRCITEAQCLSYKWVIYDDKDPTCIPTCPEGFVNRNLSGKCEKRQRSDWCEGTTITSTDLGSSLKDCSSIRGNLVIMVTGGKNVTRTLKRNLGKLEEISGYLRVVGANALRSLNFLSELRLIKGEQVSNDGCTICIFENSNLEQLWDWTVRNRSKLVVIGHIYVAFNERLCPEEVKNFFDQSGINDTNATVQSNGKSSNCVIFHSPMAAVPGKVPGTVKLSWYHNWCGIDSRTITGYSIYYRQTDRNITMYEDRDVCNEHTLWTSVPMEFEDLYYEGHCLKFELVNLKPSTRYAIYAKTHSIDKYSLQTDLIYVTTFPLQPDIPHRGSGTIRGNDLEISWQGPLESSPDGGIYEVDIQLEADKLIAGFRYSEDCQKFDRILSKQMQQSEVEIEFEPLRKYLSPSKEVCSCSYMSHDDLVMHKEERISIENEINRLYHKVFDEGSKPPQGSVAVTTTEAYSTSTMKVSYKVANPNQDSLSTESTNYVEDQSELVLVEKDEWTLLCEAGRALPGKCPDPASSWDSEYPKFAKLAIPSNWTKNELTAVSRMQHATQKNNMTVTLPPNLKMPTKITIQVRACGKKISPCRFSDSHSCVLCSNFHTWTFFKEEKIPLLHLKAIPALVDEEGKEVGSYTEYQGPHDRPSFSSKLDKGLTSPRNASEEGITEGSRKRMNLTISWDSSYDHENTVLGYKIQYVSMDVTMVIESNAICWSKLSADENENRLLVEVPVSKLYCIGIQARTVAGYWLAEEICIQIKDNITLRILIIVSVSLIVVLIVMIVYIFDSYYRPKKPVHVTNNNYYGVSDKFLRDIKPELILDKDMLTNEFKNMPIMLGSGYFGKVFKCKLIDKDNDSRRDVAVKTINEENIQKDEEALIELRQEALILQEIDSPFVIKLLGVYHHDEAPNRNLFLVFEYMHLKDLKNLLIRHRVPQQLLKELAIQIAAGMAHIHDRNFVHGDLAARNCMVSLQERFLYKNETRERWSVKVSDFGWAKILDDNNTYYHIKTRKKIPAGWMSPENLKEGKLGKKGDVWSFGVLLWEMMNEGRDPYQGCPNKVDAILKAIDQGELIRPYVNQKSFPATVMRKCLQIYSRDRPTFHELVEEILPQVSSSFKAEFLLLSNWQTKRYSDNSSMDEGIGESCNGNSTNVSHDNEEDLASLTFSTFNEPCFDAYSYASFTCDSNIATCSSYLSLP